MSLNLRRHLRAGGTVGAEEFPPCEGGATVKIQKRRANGSWATMKTLTASAFGAYGSKIPDRAGKYRAVVPAHNEPDGWICGGRSRPPGLTATELPGSALLSGLVCSGGRVEQSGSSPGS